MKSLFVTLLIFAAAIAAYDFFGSPPGQKFLFKHLNEGVVLDQAPGAPAIQTAATAPGTATEEPVSSTTAAPAPSPSLSTPVPAPMTSVPEVTKKTVDPSGFIEPNFETMEQLTQGWTNIPSNAFPRPVTLMKDAAFKMGVGSSTMRAGTSVIALAFAQGKLQLAPSASSNARSVVEMTDTDLQSLLITGYERWKVARVAILKDAHLRRLARAKAAPAPIAANSASVDPAGKPVQEVGGKYPLLAAHLKSGEVTELKLENIHRWGDAEATVHEGKPAYSILVQADVSTIFGLQPVEIKAIVQGSRVAGWFYAGSGEPVP
jgi:hypothetical protein